MEWLLRRPLTTGRQNKHDFRVWRFIFLCTKKRHSVSLSENGIAAARRMHIRQSRSVIRRLRACARTSLIGHHGAHVQNNGESDIEEGEEPRQSRSDQYVRSVTMHASCCWITIQDNKIVLQNQCSSFAGSMAWSFRTSIPESTARLLNRSQGLCFHLLAGL